MDGWLLGLSQEDELETHLGVFATAELAKEHGDKYIEMQGFPLHGWSAVGWSDHNVVNHHNRFFFRELGYVDDLPPYDSIYVTPVRIFLESEEIT